jgi:50S ribosomal protein L16 3-hydroxylase
MTGRSDMETSDLESIFSPISLSQFCDDYWPTRHYITHAAPERLSSLLTLPSLQGIDLACGANNDVQVIPEKIEKSGNENFIKSPEAMTYFNQGATLCVLNVGASIGELGEWIIRLSQALGVHCRTQCNAYLSPAGSGTPKHFDNHEVIVVQVIGQKEWVIAVNNEVEYPTVNYVAGASPTPELQSYWTPTDSMDMPEGSITVRMDPGSVLFMPRGLWHTTVATSDSLSLSIGFFLSTPLDMIIRMLRRALVQHKALRKPIAFAPNNSQYVELVENISDMTLSHLGSGMKCIVEEGSND